MPGKDSQASDTPILSLAGDDLLQLCRELLGRGAEVRFEAPGVSMAPTLRSGDVLCVRPLGDRLPMVGEVVLFERAHGKPVAHRVVGRMRTRDQWLIAAAGDAAGSGIEVLPLESVLGRVTRLEREGVPCELGCGPVRARQWLQAKADLAQHTHRPVAALSWRAVSMAVGLIARLIRLIGFRLRKPIA